MGGDQGQLTPDGKWKEPPCFPPAHTHGCFQVFLLPTLFKTAVNPCYFQFSFGGGGWPCPWHMEVSGPGTEPIPQQ